MAKKKAATKTAKKKASVKKAAPKKKAATKKKTPAKKTPAKKTPAKKTPAKKTPAKKTPAKKTPAKKKSAKKKTAKKKTATKKTATKKTATKKTATKKKATKKKVASAKKAVTKKKAVKKKAVKKQPAAASSPSSSSSDRVVPTTSVPVQLGKHPQKTYPENASPNDFKCYGPPATRDGEFDAVLICDMGCFTQDNKDSNKYYHGAVVQHKESGNWYAYFEWGRTGAQHPAFQFVGCRDEAHARQEFAKQLHSKNDRRGEWVDIASIRTLRAKKGKDCYLVRPQATRSTGLPDARSIKTNDGAKDTPAKKKKSKRKPRYDEQTMSLMRDLAVGAVAYTRGSMADESLPTQSAIDEARQILREAKVRVAKVGDSVKKQVKDRDLVDMTNTLYSRIPKIKPLRAAAAEWILSQDNILTWQADLDAFETALYSTDISHDMEDDFDPFGGVKIDMEWISPKSTTGKFLHEWWPQATANRHSGIGKMKIKNLWQVARADDDGKIPDMQAWVGKPKIGERPSFQPSSRKDLGAADRKKFTQTNTSLLFHGTRSVNVSGILREALRLPKQLVGVVITGAMFGPGLYFADDWKKSAGYTSLTNSYWSQGSGAVPGREAFMFACDVVLGKPFVAPQWGPYTEPPTDHHSVFGKAGDSGVQNNEFIVYKPEQNRLRYLAEFTTT